jgi:hypothetical protein
MIDAARRDLDRKRLQLVQGIDRPCGENAADTIHPLKRKIASRGQRVLSGLSGAGACNWVEKELQ